MGGNLSSNFWLFQDGHWLDKNRVLNSYILTNFIDPIIKSDLSKHFIQLSQGMTNLVHWNELRNNDVTIFKCTRF